MKCGFDVTGNRMVSKTVDLSSNLRTRAIKNKNDDLYNEIAKQV